MTDPPDPWQARATRRVTRELVGLLLVLAGLAVLCWLLAGVDWRLPIAAGALTAVAVGIRLGMTNADDPGGL